MGNGVMITDFTIERERLFAIFNRIILFSLVVLILVLPVAHTAAIRAMAIIIPTILWITKMVIERRPLFIRTPLDIPILLFLLTAVISILTAVDPRYTVKVIKSDLLEPVLLFYLVVNNIKREDQAKTLFLFLCIGGAVMTVYGIYDFFIKGGSLVDHNPFRATSLHTDFQYFGTYLILVFPFLILGIFSFNAWGYRLPLILLTLLSIFATYITHTRAAWVAVFAEFTFLIFLLIRRKWIPVAIITIIVFLAISLIPKKTLYREEGKVLVSSDITKVETSTAKRLVTWQFSLKEIAKNPFNGIGFGRDSFYKKYPENSEALGHTHNAFIDLAFQTGIQGLIAFLLIIYFLLKTHWVRYREGKGDFISFLSVATMTMIIGYLTRNLFDSFLLDDPLLMFWLLNGVVVGLKIHSFKD